MADLGTIAHESVIALRTPDIGPRSALRCIRVGDDYAVCGAKDNAEGDPGTPCLRLDARGVWRFRWAFASGSRTVSVRVKQVVNVTPYPSIVVRANPACGVNADVTETAAAGANWKTIGPATINPSSDGAVWVELHNNYDGQLAQAPCFFDHIVTT